MDRIALRKLFAGLILVSSTAFMARGQERGVAYAPYQDVLPLLKAAGDDLPDGVKASGEDASRRWSDWVVKDDQEIRKRLLQGVEDSLVNLLLFGNSFTRQPQIRPETLVPPAGKEQSPSTVAAQAVLRARLDDFVASLAAPGANERLLFARSFLEGKGYRLDSSEDQAAVKRHLLESLGRVYREMTGYQRELEEAQKNTDRTAELTQRSTLFRERGLSLDTSLQPNFALEQSLGAIRNRGLLEPGSVRRVAVIGPGLDFADKNAGRDFYPLQTIQPFAVMDTLLKLGLARKEALQVYTFDVSPMVNDHLARARQRASRGLGYVLQLPLASDVNWEPDLRRYWQQFGAAIGDPAGAAPVPADATQRVEVRALRVRPSRVLKIQPVDLNIVVQRLDPAPDGGFDVMIATNMFVYYDVFYQSLALLNIEHMLRPGGLLLSNNLLLELPFSNMRSAGQLTVAYSDRPADGDHIFWYQRRKN
jgi:hypothetical protein